MLQIMTSVSVCSIKIQLKKTSVPYFQYYTCTSTILNTTCVSITNFAYTSKKLITLPKYNAISIALVVPDILCIPTLSNC